MQSRSTLFCLPFTPSISSFFLSSPSTSPPPSTPYQPPNLDSFIQLSIKSSSILTLNMTKDADESDAIRTDAENRFLAECLLAFDQAQGKVTPLHQAQ